jgi:hypothetical protein
MTRSLRRVRALTATTAAALLSALLTTGAIAPAHAAPGDNVPTATISWSFKDAAALEPGAEASVTIDGHWEIDPADTDPYSYLWLYASLTIDGVMVEDDVALRPDKESVTFPIDTSDIGSHNLEVVVADESTDVVATSARTLNVVGQTTTVTAQWPAATAVKVGSRARVTGRVDGGTDRVVHLQHKTNNGWQTVVRTTTSDAYALRIPTSWYTTHSLRIFVPETQSHVGATAAQGKTLGVSPAYRPLGSKRAFSLYKWRFSPCQPIRWKINTARMPKGGEVDVRKAIAMLSTASGQTFKYAGTTSLIPWKGYSFDGSIPEVGDMPGYDLAIGWATPRQVPGLSGWTVGLGGPNHSTGRFDSKGYLESDNAGVVLDTTQRVLPGFGKGFTRGELLLHEIGHALGLDHVADVHQVMTSGKSLDRDVLGAGDLAGLRKVGRSAGCFVDSAVGFTRPARQMLSRAPDPIHAPGTRRGH